MARRLQTEDILEIGRVVDVEDNLRVRSHGVKRQTVAGCRVHLEGGSRERGSRPKSKVESGRNDEPEGANGIARPIDRRVTMD